MSRKHLIIVAAALLAVGAAWGVYQQRSRPKSLPERFAAAEDGPEKLDLALKILGAESSSGNEVDPLAAATPLQDVLAYVNETTRTFEASLSTETKERLVKDIKGSRAPILGFSLDLSRTCSREQYEAMKREIGLESLARQGVNLSIIAGLYEDRNRQTYFNLLADHLDREGCSAGSCTELATWYRSAAPRLEEIRPKIETQIKRIEDELQQQGLDRQQVFARADQYARAWPDCMGHLNMTLGEFLAMDVTRSRAEHLMSEYARLDVKSNEDLTNAVPEFDPASPLRSTNLDDWANPFAMDVSDTGVIRIVSGGPDGVIGTTDDVVLERQLKDR